MAGLFGHTSGGAGFQQTQQRRTAGAGQARPLADLLQNTFLGQLSTMPELPISTPMRQAIGATQDLLPSLLGQAFGGGGLARRLTGNVNLPGLVRDASGAAALPLREPTREELGLTATRRELFGGETAVPTTEQVKEAGLFSIPRESTAGRKQRRRLGRLERRAGRLETRQSNLATRGRDNARVDRRLERVHRQLTRMRAI